MAVILMMLALGLAVLGACALMPREIGREDEPLSSIRVSLPDVQGMALRMRQPRRPQLRPAAAPHPVALQPDTSPVEGPSALGALQPVLTEEQTGLFALPGQ